jgi:hypothetical protein
MYFGDRNDSILRIVRDIAACNSNRKTEQITEMSLGNTYYNDLNVCIYMRR